MGDWFEARHEPLGSQRSPSVTGLGARGTAWGRPVSLSIIILYVYLCIRLYKLYYYYYYYYLLLLLLLLLFYSIWYQDLPMERTRSCTGTPGVGHHPCPRHNRWGRPLSTSHCLPNETGEQRKEKLQKYPS